MKDLGPPPGQKPAGRAGGRPSDLTTLYLRHLPEAGQLRGRALSQIALKVLYTLSPDSRLTETELVQRMGVLTRRPFSQDDILKKALALLVDEGQAERGDSGWRLSEEGHARMAAEEAKHRERIAEILKRRFPPELAGPALVLWFSSMTHRYFERYGSETVAAVYRLAPPLQLPSLLPDLVGETARHHGLGEHIDRLFHGFREFIERPIKNEQEYIWSAWQSAFAAQLIAAGVGADPLTVDALGRSTVFLDTNILITAALETHRGNHAVRALAAGLNELQLRAVVLPQTIDEYRRAVERERSLVIRLLGSYDLATIGRAKSPFLHTALARKHFSRPALERFFDELERIPTVLAGVFTIEEGADAEVAAFADAGANDARLVADIASSFAARHPGSFKGPDSARHDAALTHVVEGLRKANRQAWVLTLDSAMCFVAARRTPRNVLPSWMSVYALLPVLAIERGGPSMRATDFGGLLAAMFENDLHPILETFELVDLEWLREIESQATELAPEAIERVAMRVARARLEGRSRLDGELRLEVGRAFRRERRPILEERDAAVTGLTAAEERLREERALRERMEQRLRDEISERLRLAAWRRFLIRAFVVVCATLVVTLGGLTVAVAAGAGLDSAAGAVLLSLPMFALTYLYEQVRELRVRLSSAQAEAAVAPMPMPAAKQSDIERQ